MPISNLLSSLQESESLAKSGSSHNVTDNGDDVSQVLPNILIIITDQERSIQHWSESFSQQHLPSMERLKKHGITFQQHYTNACMCSPSRATLLTSQFPVRTGVTKTGSPGPPIALPTNIPNLATVMKQAGYRHVQWYGKWHLGKTPSDYGFDGWQPPDAGNYLTINETLGGGTPNNDGRFLQEACQFLKEHHQTSSQYPFCMVVSFVNPHDVYVAQHSPCLGYQLEDFQKIHVPVPSNWDEDTDANHKPRAHSQMSIRYVTFDNSPQDYVNFYAYLHTLVDLQIMTLLNALDEYDYTSTTLILRTADHGEQALSHSLVEKFFNTYEESIHIPLVISNPLAFPMPQHTSVLTSHVDILPTLAHICGIVDKSTLASNDIDWKGKDLWSVLETTTPPSIHKLVDDSMDIGATAVLSKKCNLGNEFASSTSSCVHFTYDDIGDWETPSIIRCIRTKSYKYAVYFTEDGTDADWELYCLENDPLENLNLAGHPQYQSIQQELDGQLVQEMKRCQTMPTNFVWPPSSSPYSRGAKDQHVAP